MLEIAKFLINFAAGLKDMSVKAFNLTQEASLVYTYIHTTVLSYIVIVSILLYIVAN